MSESNEQHDAEELETAPLVRSIFDALETDESLETQGVEFYFGLGIGYWKLAWSGATPIQGAIADAMKPYTQLSQADLRNPAIETSIRNAMVEVYVEHVIKGWRDVVGEEGIIEYSPEKALEFMKNPRISRELFKLIREYSGNFANYRKIYAEDVAGK